MKKRKELQGRIRKIHRIRKIALAGLIVGIALSILGQLITFEPLFILGYAAFLFCTAATTFLTVLRWQYTKALKQKIEEKAKPPPPIVCSRCGTEVKENLKYCPKCGKKINRHKH